MSNPNQGQIQGQNQNQAPTVQQGQVNVNANQQQGQQNANVNQQQGQQVQQNVNVNPIQPQQQPPIVLKKLSKWATLGLDLSDPGFSKLHAKESKPSDDEESYDLLPEKFESYRRKLIEKIKRTHSTEVFSVVDLVANQWRYIPTEYTRVTLADVENMRDIRWPQQLPNFQTQQEADLYTDNQLKASCLGSYIHESLTEAAQKQLKAQEDIFTVMDTEGNEYYDGPSYFHVLADVVDPDNAHMIENVRKRLRELNVKDYGYSVIKMLAEFKLLKQRIGELGGTYDEDDQFLDFWECLKTMKEKEFSRYVRAEKDSYRKLTRANRGNIDRYIRDFTKKELDMKEDNEWNVVSQEDAMIMALVNSLEQKSKKKKVKRNNQRKDTEKDDENCEDDEKDKKRKWVTPEWKLTKPKLNEPHEKVVNGRTYYFCPKCNKGDGMWALHKPSDHKDNWKVSKPEKETKKSVSFSAETKGGEKEDVSDDDSDGPSIEVHKSLIHNAKSYLAQFQNFQEGGTQG